MSLSHELGHFNLHANWPLICGETTMTIIPKVSVIHNWRNEINKQGLYSVYLRISINGHSKYLKLDTPQKISSHQWSGKEEKWVRNNHPAAFEINNRITEKRAIISDLIKRSYLFNKQLTFETVFSVIKRKGDRNSFYDFMQSYINRPSEALAINTMKK